MAVTLLDSPLLVVNMQAGSVRAPRRAVRGSEAHAIQKRMRESVLGNFGCFRISSGQGFVSGPLLEFRV